MFKISWNQFKIKNPNCQEAFENLCYHLFCRRFKINEGVFRYRNQTGIETEPIKVGTDYVAFQSKYFEVKIDQEQIISSIEKAKKKNQKLTKITIYINLEFSESSKPKVKDAETKKAIESAATKLKIKLDWVVPSNFDVLLQQSSNLDLAQLYFNVGDEFGFIKSCCDTRILTFLQSSEHINLPFEDKNRRLKKFIEKEILKHQDKIFLLVGHPGSGKSIYMHNLLRNFGGLDRTKKTGVNDVVVKNNAIPMLVSLKDCLNDSLENIVRNRQKDFKLRGGAIDIIYLFDGLDELDEEKADSVLTYIVRLAESSNAAKIIISCRSGNANRRKAKVYLSSIIEYQISDLDEVHIEAFFKAKGDDEKTKQLDHLKKTNKVLLNKINDILLIRLLWEIIGKIDRESSIIDLIPYKIDTLFNDPRHKKNIDELNVLNPKEKIILGLNEEISFEFYKKFQFRFPQNELQGLIIRELPRIDYKAINFILNYLASMFFDAPMSGQEGQTYIYQHRRYQDFFFARKLKGEYEKNPRILRELRVLSNQEFFRELFLPFLRKRYEKEGDLPRLIKLNLIDVYLGENRGWGADDPYYANSPEFIPALAAQQNDLFEQLLEDETLQLKDKLHINQKDVKSNLDEWEKDKKNFRTKNYLKNVWTEDLPFLIKCIAAFWKTGKQNLAKELFANLAAIEKLFEKYEFSSHLEDHEKVDDPFWKRWEDWAYIRLALSDKAIDDIFISLIRKNYASVSEERHFASEESGKEKLLKSFFRACLRHGRDIFDLTSKFDDYELLQFLTVLATNEFLPIFVREKAFHVKLKKYLQSYEKEVTPDNLLISFYKSFLKIQLHPDEVRIINEQLSNILNERSVDWRMHNNFYKYATLAYSIGKNSFSELLKNKEGTPLYYNEIMLHAALFASFIELLENKKNISSIIRDYLKYTEKGEKVSRRFHMADISFIWSHIFAYSKSETNELLPLKRILLQRGEDVIPFRFFYKLNRINKSLFNNLIEAHEIEAFEGELSRWTDDFPSYVDRCCELAQFYSDTNKQKVEKYISMAINEGMLRHGWRKDPIVSYYLVEAIELLWRNNWLHKNISANYAREIFELALRVTEITDGSETSRGPYNIINLAAQYDIELAEELRRRLIHKKGPDYSANKTLASILLEKVKIGLPPETLIENMKEYTRSYDYKGKTYPEYFLSKFEVYVAVATNVLYTEEERKDAFERAYEQIELMKRETTEIFQRDIDYLGEKNEFIELCKKYNKPNNLPEKEQKENRAIDESGKPKISEDRFISEFNHAKNEREIREYYKKLGNYEEGIVLKKRESWQALIKKTFQIMGSVELFAILLRNNYYPSSAHATSNSRYYHYGVAEALNNVDTKEEMLKYLYNNSGHQGFTNIMKAYEVNNDKKMCIKLFEHYLEFCKFLVY